MKIDILGCYVDNVSMFEALEKIKQYIKERTPRQIITLNAEIIYNAQEDSSLKELINNADMVTPDGAGVILASNILKTPLKERVTGIDLMQEILEMTEKEAWKIYFYGASPGTAELAVQNIKKNYKDINIVGTAHGYIKEENMSELIADIKEKAPDILFVALGAPRQEYWIKKYKEELQVPVSIGIGGSFDVLAGKVKRAPKIFQEFKLEWFYRLLKEPWRYKRMMSLPKFIFKILKKSARKQK